MKNILIKEIYSLLRELEIHPSPETLTTEELQLLTSPPRIRKTILERLQIHGNFYQELDMSSSFVEARRDISYDKEPLRLHSHSFYEIIYCESGNIQYLINGKRYRIHPGDIILIPPGISHRPLFYEQLTSPYSRIVLWFSADYMKTVAQCCSPEELEQLRNRELFLLRTEGTSYKYLEKIFLRCLEDASTDAPYKELALCGTCTNLLAHLARAFLLKTYAFPAETPEELDRIISYVEANYSGKVTLEDTARAFHISTSTLGKLFYNKLGVSFYHFVTQRRLINSKGKIEKGNSMEEVALACGFCDYSAFYRAFKKEYGISPRQYRNLVSVAPES